MAENGIGTFDGSEQATAMLTDDQMAEAWANATPDHPALRRVHQKLNQSSGAEAAITSYDRMHHRHSRS